MNDRDLLRQERLERVKIFGTENHEDWPANSAERAPQREKKPAPPIVGTPPPKPPGA